MANNDIQRRTNIPGLREASHDLKTIFKDIDAQQHTFVQQFKRLIISIFGEYRENNF